MIYLLLNKTIVNYTICPDECRDYQLSILNLLKYYAIFYAFNDGFCTLVNVDNELRSYQNDKFRK